MRRRDFIVGALLAASAMPKQVTLARNGPKIPRVGYLGTKIGPASLPPIEAFREGLRQLGYTEGRSIIVDYRWARGPADAVAAAHAIELVSARPRRGGELSLCSVAPASKQHNPDRLLHKFGPRRRRPRCQSRTAR
jgi:hypothetical protein